MNIIGQEVKVRKTGKTMEIHGIDKDKVLVGVHSTGSVPVSLEDLIVSPELKEAIIEEMKQKTVKSGTAKKRFGNCCCYCKVGDFLNYTKDEWLRKMKINYSKVTGHGIFPSEVWLIPGMIVSMCFIIFFLISR